MNTTITRIEAREAEQHQEKARQPLLTPVLEILAGASATAFYSMVAVTYFLVASIKQTVALPRPKPQHVPLLSERVRRVKPVIALYVLDLAVVGICSVAEANLLPHHATALKACVLDFATLCLRQYALASLVWYAGCVLVTVCFCSSTSNDATSSSNSNQSEILVRGFDAKRVVDTEAVDMATTEDAKCVCGQKAQPWLRHSPPPPPSMVWRFRNLVSSFVHRTSAKLGGERDGRDDGGGGCGDDDVCVDDNYADCCGGNGDRLDDKQTTSTAMAFASDIKLQLMALLLQRRARRYAKRQRCQRRK